MTLITQNECILLEIYLVITNLKLFLVTAKLMDFTAWNCERGAEIVFGGQIQFVNFTMLDNEKSGLDFVEVKGPLGDCNEGPGAVDSLVVGHSAITADLSDDLCTHAGYFGPKLYGATLCNTHFANFDREGCAALSMCSQCKAFTGLATNSIFFCFLFVKTHCFAWRANQ